MLSLRLATFFLSLFTLSQIYAIGTIVEIASGNHHALALDYTGHVYSWGDNSHGQLGLGDRDDRNIPTEVTALRGKIITQIAAAEHHGFAIECGGKVYAWGWNNFGQLGLGNNGPGTERNTPTEIIDFQGITISQIVVGGHHNLALDSDGKVYAWGVNGFGQLGLGHADPVNLPTEVTGLSDKNIIKISAGGNHNLALDSSGKVYAWGRNDLDQLGLGNLVGSVINTPTEVTGLSDKNIIKISAGGNHNLALDSSGKVYAWGENSNGKLGFESMAGGVNTPTEVTGLSDKTVIEISAGGRLSLAVDDAGNVYFWGRRDSQFGHGIISTPTLIFNLSTVTPTLSGGSLSATGSSSLTGGTGGTGMLNDTVTGSSPVPEGTGGTSSPTSEGPTVNGTASATGLPMGTSSPVPGGTGGTSSATSEGPTVNGTASATGLPGTSSPVPEGTGGTSSLTSEGGPTVNGTSSATGMGIGTGTSSIPPKQILSQATDISAGGEHSLVRSKDGVSVDAFGENTYGQLGLGEDVQDTERHSPTQIKDVSDIVQMSAGGEHSLILNQEGDVYAFGGNAKGQLGVGSDEVVIKVPTRISKNILLPPMMASEDDGSSSWKFIALGAGGLVVIGGAVAAYYYYKYKHSQGDRAQERPQEAAHQGGSLELVPGGSGFSTRSGSRSALLGISSDSSKDSSVHRPLQAVQQGLANLIPQGSSQVHQERIVCLTKVFLM